MRNLDLRQLANMLIQSNQYKVLTKYQQPDFYNLDNTVDKLIGVFLDIEATGLSYKEDKIIELRW